MVRRRVCARRARGDEGVGVGAGWGGGVGGGGWWMWRTMSVSGTWFFCFFRFFLFFRMARMSVVWGSWVGCGWWAGERGVLGWFWGFGGSGRSCRDGGLCCEELETRDVEMMGEILDRSPSF